MKLLGAEEDELAEGDGERAGQLIAARDQLVHHRSDPNHRFLHRQLSVPFLSGHYPPTIYHYAGKWQVSALFPFGERTNFKKAQQMRG